MYLFKICAFPSFSESVELPEPAKQVWSATNLYQKLRSILTSVENPSQSLTQK